MNRVLTSGLLGGLELALLGFVSNAVLGFKSRLDLRPIPNESRVYEVLKENITEPGGYMCNPALTPAGFTHGEPVFGIHYSGMGHEAAGVESLMHLAIAFIAAIIAAGMLAAASEQILSTYSRRVLCFAVIGLLIAVYGDLARFGIGAYSLNTALEMAAYDLVSWTLAGLAVAWKMKPAPAVVAHS